MKQRKQLILQPLPCRSSEIGRWLSALEDTRHRTRVALEGIEADALKIIDWVSPINGNSIGLSLYHLAAIEASWLYEEVLQEDFPSDIEGLLPYDVRDGQDHLTSVKGIFLKDYWNRLEQIRTKLLIAYTDMTLERFHNVRSMPDYDVTPAFVLHHLMQHEGEHRGQITELRLNAEQVIRPK
jgi:DinB family protein